MKWIRWLLGMCQHQWEDKSVVDILENANDSIPYARKMRQRCSVCGNYRRVDY